MIDYSRQEAAERAGISLDELNQLVELKGVGGAMQLHSAHRA